MEAFDDRRSMLADVLVAAARDCADAADALAVANRVDTGDPDAWVYEWSALAGGARADGITAATQGRRADAHRLLLRAATYYAAALGGIAASTEPERGPALWRRQRDCFDAAAALLALPPARVQIPYERSSIAGSLFRAPDAGPGELRPLVVIDRGEATLSQAYVLAGAAAAERGYHWLAFDGPGQGAARYERGPGWRPDWEAVLTPVVDAALDQPGVDPACLAVVGLGRGGYHVVRALASEHRFAAAVADPGVWDLAAPSLDALPGSLRALVERGNAEQFDREMRLVALFSPAAAAAWRRRGGAIVPSERSAFRHLRRLAAYRVGAEASAIVTPILLTEREDEPLWAGQAAALARRLAAPHEVVRLAAIRSPSDAAGREAALFGWLDRHLATAGGARVASSHPVRSPRPVTGKAGRGD